MLVVRRTDVETACSAVQNVGILLSVAGLGVGVCRSKREASRLPESKSPVGTEVETVGGLLAPVGVSRRGLILLVVHILCTVVRVAHIVGIESQLLQHIRQMQVVHVRIAGGGIVRIAEIAVCRSAPRVALRREACVVA